MNNIKMLYYDRIDVSEGTDIDKASETKECDVCHYWYFLNKGLKKDKFYRHESPIFLKDVDIEKVLVSNKISSGEKNYKYFIGYLYNYH